MSVQPPETSNGLTDCRMCDRTKDLKAPHYVGVIAIPMLCRSCRDELLGEGL